VHDGGSELTAWLGGSPGGQGCGAPGGRDPHLTATKVAHHQDRGLGQRVANDLRLQKFRSSVQAFEADLLGLVVEGCPSCTTVFGHRKQQQCDRMMTAWCVTSTASERSVKYTKRDRLQAFVHSFSLEMVSFRGAASVADHIRESLT
jgi:hypothetical protein